MERQSDERRNGTDTTAEQASRQPADSTDRQPPAAIHIMGRERNAPRQASTWRRDRRQEIRMRNESTPQSHRNRRLPANRVARRGEMMNRPDRRDDERGERRNEPMSGKQDIGRTPRTDEMRTPSPPPQPIRQVSRPTGRRRGNTMNRLSILAQPTG